MNKKIYWLKYLSPIFGILFCPVTILFFWSIWSGPVVNSESDLVEEVKL